MSDKEDLISNALEGNSENYDFDLITPKPWTDINVHGASGDLAAMESVCGPDNRIRVPNTRAMPYQAICKLYMRSNTGKNFIGSGFLTHSNKVVTAGHCVFDHREGGWMDSIIVVPGKNGPSEPFGRFYGSMVGTVREWIENQSSRYDMGVIKLTSNVNHPGRLQMVSTDSDRGTVCGYPGDRDQGVFQYKMEETLSKSDGRFYYSIDTFGGQSGCPVLKSSNSAIGIHNYGGCPNKASDLYQKFIDQVNSY